MFPATQRLVIDELCELVVDFEQFQIFPTALGTRLVAVASGGRVKGPRLQGDVLPGGGDWLLLGSDGLARMDVRASIRTSDGQILYMTGLGRTEIPAGARDRFLAGETVADDEIDARLTLLFEADDGTYGWLNATVAAALVTELSQRHIRYNVFEIRRADQ